VHDLARRRSCLNFIPFGDPFSVERPDARILDHNELLDYCDFVVAM
jgi:hypothetical protein